MKRIIGLSFLLILSSCHRQHNNKTEESNTVKVEKSQEEIQNTVSDFDEVETVFQKKIAKQDSLFELEINIEQDFVEIAAPLNSDFELTNSSVLPEPFKIGDFNADNKKDILVYLGSCGTGGCMYALFLKHKHNQYKLAFMAYLKNPEFGKEENGFWTIKSSEEVKAYDPSKIIISIFKFDSSSHYYNLDTSYIHASE